MTNFPNGLSSYGVPVIGGGLPTTFGNVWFVDYRNGSDNNDGKSKTKSLKTLSAAYDKAVTNNNDLILIDGDSTVEESAEIVWSKNRIHVIGLDGAPGRLVQQGVKIQSATATTDDAVVTVTGTRNSFYNLKVIQAGTAATALHVWKFAGEGNYYQNCSFVFGVVDNLDLTTAFEALMGEDAGTFVNCSFGTDVLLTSAARTVMSIDAISGASSSDGLKSCRFIDCEWVIMSSDANATLVKLADTVGAKFLNKFVRPQFHAVRNQSNVAIAITNAFASASGYVEGVFHIDSPKTFDCTNTCAGVTDMVELYAAATSNNAHEASTPA
jgi:hypothetical protein